MGIGGEPGAAFVTHENVPDRTIQFANSLVQRQGLSTRNPENIFHTTLRQQLCQFLPNIHAESFSFKLRASLWAVQERRYYTVMRQVSNHSLNLRS